MLYHYEIIPHWILLGVVHLPVAWQFPSAICGSATAARCPSFLIIPTPTFPLLLSLTSVLSLDPVSHSLSVLLPHSGSPLLHSVFCPHTTAARSKETASGGTQTFLPMLSAWSQYLHDKQSWTNMGLSRKSQCIGLNPAPNLCGRSQALILDSDSVEQLFFSRSWVLKNCDSPSCTQTQMIILS